MTAWTSDELAKIGAAEEPEIALLRHDGRPRHPVAIRVVRHGDVPYVRSVKGRGAVLGDAAFADADRDLADQTDAAYRSTSPRCRWGLGDRPGQHIIPWEVTR